ncbi:MAG: hypothetical protein WAL50_15885 [Kineosporiaceae bacterium]
MFASRPRQPRTAPPSSSRQGKAVVLGGSLTGLLAAHVLARHFADVVIVDRDALDVDLDQPRRGVPQGRHTHGLLVGGLQAMEDLLPGLTSGLVARGGLSGDVVARARWHLGGGSLRQFTSGLSGMLASRTLIESEVRRRVVATPEISLLGGHDIVSLLASKDRSQVIGVQVARRDTRPHPTGDGPASIGSRTLDVLADVVVDATGRGSRAPAWLADLGYPAPPETVVPADITYVTRLFHARQGVLDELDADVIGTNPPDPRGGVALRQEADRWTLTLAGMHGLRPPTELDQFIAYAADLPTPGLAQIARECSPIGDAMVYRFPASRWRRWEKVSRRPLGLLMIGDAVCSFNPVYGQGMSSAAQQALALATLLQDGSHDLPRLAAKVFAHVVAVPWALATGSDRRYPGQAPKRLPEKLLDRYLDRLLRVARGFPLVSWRHPLRGRPRDGRDEAQV